MLYLTVYNCFCIFLWASTLFTRHLTVVTLTQAFAYLDVIHVMLGLVKTPVLTSFIQTSAKLFIVCLYNLYPEHYSKCTVVTWCITEIIRYGYYSNRSKFMQFLRYNMFIVLYPIGFSCELYTMYCIYQVTTDNGLKSLLSVIIVLYTPVFVFMYKYMFSQRAKYLKN